MARRLTEKHSDPPGSTARAVSEIAHFLRAEWTSSEHFEPWPGLPSTPGVQPTLKEANFFFLGCCIDLQERYKVAWTRARRFFADIVPSAEQEFLWRWISNHSEKDWILRAQDYKLHRFPAFHKRIHRIATSLQRQFGGDPRLVWAPKNLSNLLLILEQDLRVGPAISRMIIGALRDHRLVSLTRSDFKPDRHVCRQMQWLGLSKTSEPDEVLKVAKKYFDDPWIIDSALFYLGLEFGITDRKEFLHFHKGMKKWLRERCVLARRLPAIRGEIHRLLGEDTWEVHIESSLHWLGLSLARKNGRLYEPMHVRDGSALWAWIGIGFYGDFVLGIELGGEPSFLDFKEMGKLLKKLKFVSDDESRDPFSDRLSLWRQEKFSLSGESHLRSSFNGMARMVTDLVVQIEEGTSCL